MERKWLWGSSWPRRGLLRSCWSGGTGLAPQSGAVTEQSGKRLAFSPRGFTWLDALTVRHFRQFPTFLGIFSSNGLEGSSVAHWFVTHGFLVLPQLFKNKFLSYVVSQDNEGLIDQILKQRYIEGIKRYLGNSEHICGLLMTDLSMKYMYVLMSTYQNGAHIESNWL